MLNLWSWFDSVMFPDQDFLFFIYLVVLVLALVFMMLICFLSTLFIVDPCQKLSSVQKNKETVGTFDCKGVCRFVKIFYS